jgi:hypothetical protein
VAAAVGATEMTEKDSTIAAALATATCSLLGVATIAPAQAQEVPKWQVDTAALYYGESDGRVKDASVSVSARRDFQDDRFLSLDLSVDSLTGASPNGALAQGGAQTFTSPSGKASYSTNAEKIPLDDTFKDTRVAGGIGWTQPIARLYTFSAGLGVSSEYDYQHAGANLGLSRDFNQRNTTVSAGLSYSNDTIDPVGGAPTPLSQMRDVGDLTNRNGSKSKDIVDALLGVTQIINRTTVVRLNYSYSDSSGYLNDPYKILSGVDPASGDAIVRTPATGTTGPGNVYLFESRPDARRKQALYGELKKYLSGKVLSLSYRYMTDDWGIDSNTVEAKLRWPFATGMYLEPTLRFYTQTAADFYRLSLPLGQPLPQFASADYRLSDFNGTTVGLKFGRELSSGQQWSARLEYYQQTGNAPAALLIGNQANRDQTPGLKAVIAQFTYRFGF